MRIASITVLLAMALCVAVFGLAYVEAPSGFDGSVHNEHPNAGVLP